MSEAAARVARAHNRVARAQRGRRDAGVFTKAIIVTSDGEVVATVRSGMTADPGPTEVVVPIRSGRITEADAQQLLDDHQNGDRT